MLGYGYLGHEDSDDRNARDRVAREHRRLIGIVAENALEGAPLTPPLSVGQRRATDAQARKLAGRILDGWLESSKHRANLMKRSHTHLGACVSSTDTLMDVRATQIFSKVSAYLDEPLPWTMTSGDSVSVSFDLVAALRAPKRYKFVPPGQSMGQSFGLRWGTPLNDGVVHLPDASGTYELRFMVAERTGQHTIRRGPRVKVQKSEAPAS